MRRLDSLTGLRFVAALLVFGLHASGLLRSTPLDVVIRFLLPGYVGVSFFYMLSGFVLMWSARPDDRPASFWRRRAARILPAYWVAWLLGLAVSLWAGSALTKTGVALTATLLQSWAPDDSVYFAVNGPAWSLSCEAFFYLVSPALLPALARLDGRRRRQLLVGITGVVVVVQAIVLGGDVSETSLWAVTVLPPARLPEFVIGALLALEVADGRGRAIPFVPSLLLTGAVIVIVGGVLEMNAQPYTVVPFALLIVAAARRDVDGTTTVFTRPAAVALGVWSYAFYLVHEPILRGLSEVFGPVGSGVEGVGRFVLALGVATLGALALHQLVERPLEARLRAARDPQATVARPSTRG